MWVFLCAGHLDAPHFLPGVVQLHVDRVDARVVGRHRIAHVSGDPMLLHVENTGVIVRTQEEKGIERCRMKVHHSRVKFAYIRKRDSQENDACM